MEEFNRGIYDYIIATDEVHSMGRGGVSSGSHGNKRKPHKRKRDKEYGVARGIDFQGGLYLNVMIIYRYVFCDFGLNGILQILIFMWKWYRVDKV